MASATPLMVPSRPQNVPSNPRKTIRPMKYREISRLSSRRELMLSSSERKAAVERVSRPVRSRIIAAMGARRRGSGSLDVPWSPRFSRSIQAISGYRRSTCQKM